MTCALALSCMHVCRVKASAQRWVQRTPVYVLYLLLLSRPPSLTLGWGAVLQLLKEELAGSVHALSLTTSVPQS